MPLFSFEGKSPRMHPTAFIAPTANLIGDVTVEENVSVWYKICALNATRRPKPTGSTSGRSPQDGIQSSHSDVEFARRRNSSWSRSLPVGLKLGLAQQPVFTLKAARPHARGLTPRAESPGRL